MKRTKFTPEEIERIKSIKPLTLKEKLKCCLYEIDRLQADKARLDWLEIHPYTAYRARDYETNKLERWHCLVDEDAPESRRGIVKLTLREAIDEARSRK